LIFIKEGQALVKTPAHNMEGARIYAVLFLNALIKKPVPKTTKRTNKEPITPDNDVPASGAGHFSS